MERERVAKESANG